MRLSYVVCAVVVATAGPLRAAEIAGGVVVDGATVFLRAEAQEIEARDVATGTLRWSSAEAARPLAVQHGRLLAQSAAPGGRLGLTVLDAATGGRLGGSEVALPPGVRALLDETVGARFDVHAEAAGARVRLAWTWDSRPERGTFDEDDPDEGVQRMQGALDVDLLTGRAVNAPPPAPAGLPRLPDALARDAAAGAFRERPQRVGALLVATQGSDRGLFLRRFTRDGRALPEVPLPAGVRFQLGSADAAHVLVSGEQAGAPPAEAHAWTVIALDTGAPVAQARTSTAAAPFAVAAGRLLVVQQPWGRRTDAGWRDQPRRLEVVDLRGAAVWTEPLHDPAWRGPAIP